MGYFTEDVIITTVKNSGVVLIETEGDNFYFIASNIDILKESGLNTSIEFNTTAFTTVDIKTNSLIVFNYSDIKNMYLVSIPSYLSPGLIAQNKQQTPIINETSKRYIEKFKMLDQNILKNKVDNEVFTKVSSFISINKKLDNMFNLQIDEQDENILLYDSGVCNFFYQAHKEKIEFLTPRLGILLEFFDKTVRDKFIAILDNKEKVLELAKNSWYTLLSIRKEESLKKYIEDAENIKKNSKLTDFEKEYMITSLQNEREKLENYNFNDYINLIDDPEYLIRVWPFLNISLESEHVIITNLGSQAVNEELNVENSSKPVILACDYFFKLIKIIKQYIPNDTVTISNCFDLFLKKRRLELPGWPHEDEKILQLKTKVLIAKKAALEKRKAEILSYLEIEKNENEEQEIKNEIQEIIEIVNRTQQEIDSLNIDLNIIDILEFWPPALYPIPNELDPNK